MGDICERLRSEVAWEPEVGQLLSDAADEIERLRTMLCDLQSAESQRLQPE
jgi:hypothetical protein